MSIEGCPHGPKDVIPQPCAECVREREAQVRLENRLENLFEALGDQAEAIPDDELLGDVRARGDDPATVASRTRELLRQAVDAHDRKKAGEQP